MITEEIFAQEEARLGKPIHLHDDVWWTQVAPGYCKPVHEFRPFPPGCSRPRLPKAWVGYSHQVPEAAQGTRNMAWNVLQGEDLAEFSLERLKSKRRNMVRGGLRDCRVDVMAPDESTLEQMRQINISQARRFTTIREKATFLPPDYYVAQAVQWRADMLKLFGHSGHQFFGAYVDDRLVAYVDLIQVADTWMFGAVKSCDEDLKHRPVDALYFHILLRASQCGDCRRVVNGGGSDERPSLTSFKGEFLLKPVVVPYYTRTLIPLEQLRRLKNLIPSRRSPRATNAPGSAEKPAVE